MRTGWCTKVAFKEPLNRNELVTVQLKLGPLFGLLVLSIPLLLIPRNGC